MRATCCSICCAASPPYSRRRSRIRSSAYPIIGASGAISGVLGAYLLLFPRAKVLTLVLLPFFFTTVRVPAMLLLLLWFAVQLVSDLAVSGGGAGVAFRAHIGGFLAGMLLVPLLKRRDVTLFAPMSSAGAHGGPVVLKSARGPLLEGHHVVTPSSLGLRVQEERRP